MKTNNLTDREKSMIISGAFYTLNMGSAIIGIIETGICAISGKNKLMYYYGLVSAYNLLIASHHKERYHVLQDTRDCSVKRWNDPRLKESTTRTYDY